MDNEYVLPKRDAVKHTPVFPERTVWRVTWDEYSIQYRVFPTIAAAERFLIPYDNHKNWKIWAGSYLAGYVANWKTKHAENAA